MPEALKWIFGILAAMTLLKRPSSSIPQKTLITQSELLGLPKGTLISDYLGVNLGAPYKPPTPKPPPGTPTLSQSPPAAPGTPLVITNQQGQVTNTGVVTTSPTVGLNAGGALLPPGATIQVQGTPPILPPGAIQVPFSMSCPNGYIQSSTNAYGRVCMPGSMASQGPTQWPQGVNPTVPQNSSIPSWVGPAVQLGAPIIGAVSQGLGGLVNTGFNALTNWLSSPSTPTPYSGAGPVQSPSSIWNPSPGTNFLDFNF